MNDVWHQRFQHPSIGMPAWAADNPERCVYAANTSGSWQIYAWDRARRRHRQVTTHPTGVRSRAISPDGGVLTWFDDDHGSECGTWLCQPFHGGPVTPLVRDTPPGWRTGLALGPADSVAVGIATRDGYQVRVGRIGGRSMVLYQHAQSAAPAGFSSDGSLVAVAHCERSRLTAQALHVYETAHHYVVGELSDGAERGLLGPVFAPTEQDRRIAFLHDRFDLLRPGIWDPVTGRRQDFDLDLPGDVEIVDWWADWNALALVHSHHGRDEIYRLDLSDGRLTRTPHPPGTVTDVAVRPNLDVWFRWSAGGTPPRIEVAGTGESIPDNAPGPGRGHRYRAWDFVNKAGQTVHGFLAAPAGSAPFPTLLYVHGGPHQHDADTWNPKVQALVDHGWAVALVNYRGSAGRGRAWLDLTMGDPGRPEVDDLVAARAQLIRAGFADPDRVAIAGGSWGGYLTLLTIGMVPDGWHAAAAFSPLADLVTAYREQAASVRALLRMLFGGSPEEKPNLYMERSPLTYAHQIRTPLLIVAGQHDTRSPLTQILRYCQHLDKAGIPHKLIPHPAGHTNIAVREQIRQTTELLNFIGPDRRRIPGRNVTLRSF